MRSEVGAGKGPKSGPKGEEMAVAWRQRTREAWEPFRDARMWALLFFAELCLTRGVGYGFLPAGRGDPPSGLLAVSPFWLKVYCIAWILAGVLCVVLGVTRRRWRIVMGFVPAPAFMWAASYFASWMKLGNWQLWIAVLLYQAVAGAMFATVLSRPAKGWR